MVLFLLRCKLTRLYIVVLQGISLVIVLLYQMFTLLNRYFFSELWGKAMVAYTKPQQRKREESERLRGERDQIRSRLLILDLKDGKL